MLTIFDIDDTLLRTLPVAYAKTCRTAELMGLVPPSDERFRAVFGRLTLPECLRYWHGELDPDAWLAVYNTLRKDFPYQPMPGVADVVAALRAAGHELAILTNGPGDKTVRKLAAAGIDVDSLRFVRHADNARRLKPDVEAFTDLVSDFGVEPADSVYVSDRPEDGTAALLAGFGFVGVCTGVWTAADFRDCGLPEQVVCTDLRSVLSVVPAFAP